MGMESWEMNLARHIVIVGRVSANHQVVDSLRLWIVPFSLVLTLTK